LEDVLTMPASQIPIGIKGEHTITVTDDIAINFLGVEGGRVLATPALIMNLEMAARNSIKPFLGDEHDSLGTEVCVKHLAATPMGMKVTFRAEVIAVEERRVRFKVEAFDEKDRISEGTHERGVINIAKFVARLSQKRA
jgi:fluoroacetyl-CoA thioesterase